MTTTPFSADFEIVQCSGAEPILSGEILALRERLWPRNGVTDDALARARANNFQMLAHIDSRRSRTLARSNPGFLPSDVASATFPTGRTQAQMEQALPNLQRRGLDRFGGEEGAYLQALRDDRDTVIIPFADSDKTRIINNIVSVQSTGILILITPDSSFARQQTEHLADLGVPVQLVDVQTPTSDDSPFHLFMDETKSAAGAIFMSPQTLSVNPALREVLVIAGQSSRIRGIVFDEAHHMGDPQSCGLDFMRLASVPLLFVGVPMVFVFVSLTEDMVEGICRLMMLDRPGRQIPLLTPIGRSDDTP